MADLQKFWQPNYPQDRLSPVLGSNIVGEFVARDFPCYGSEAPGKPQGPPLALDRQVAWPLFPPVLGHWSSLEEPFPSVMSWASALASVGEGITRLLGV